jgi:hypothetical protein
VPNRPNTNLLGKRRLKWLYRKVDGQIGAVLSLGHAAFLISQRRFCVTKRLAADRLGSSSQTKLCVETFDDDGL